MKLWQEATIAAVAMVALGSIGGIVTAGSVGGWYAELDHPPGVPPNWVFGPVWTLLYAMIGISFARFRRRVEPGPAKRRALAWFFVQLVLNLVWTPIFFGAHRLGFALIVIGALLIAILVTLVLFRLQ